MNHDDKISVDGQQRVRYYNGSGVVTSDVTYSKPSHGSESVVRGNAPRAKPQGYLRPTPYYRKEVHYVNTNGWEFQDRSRSEGPKAGYRTDGVLGTDWRVGGKTPSVNLVDVDLLSQAEVKALNKLAQGGKENLLALGVAWGERRETAHLLEETAVRIYKAFHLLRKGQWRKAQDLFPVGSRKKWAQLRDTPYGRWLQRKQSKALKHVKGFAPTDALASAILEYQNGWMPLLSDIHASAEALANRNLPEHWLLTGRGKHFLKKEGVVQYGEDNRYVQNPKRIREYTLEYGARVILHAYPQDPFFRALNQLGMVNPASDLWQLTFASYIVDYMVGIGAWLQSLSAPQGLVFHSGCYTKFCRYVAMERSADLRLGRFSGRYNSVEMDRRVYAKWPVPIPPLSLKPGKLNMYKLTNVSAMLYTMLRGIRVDGRG